MKSDFKPKWLTRELIKSAFSGIKIPGVLSSPPLDGMIVHCRVIPDSLQSAFSLRNRQSFILANVSAKRQYM